MAADSNPWPNWARSTLTAAVGFGAGVFAVAIAFADVRALATNAKGATDDHEVRIRSLESHSADLRALKDQVVELRADIKVLLQRTATGR